MEVRVCKNCKRLFQYITGPELCYQCNNLMKSQGNDPQKDDQTKEKMQPMIKEEEEKLIQVKDFIMAHPRATIVQVSEANDVPVKKIFQWVREERIEFSDDSKEAWFSCEKCGAKIKSGRFCNKCKGR